MRADTLLASYHAGNLASGHAVVAAYEPLCLRMARRWRRTWLDADDVRQEARLAVWRAIDPHASTPFDPTRGNLTLWLERAINTALGNYVRREACRRKRMAYLDDPVHDDGLTLGETLAAVVEDSAEVVAREERIDVMRRHIETLPVAQRDILRRRMTGASLRDVGAAIGVTGEMVRLREIKAHQAVRRLMAPWRKKKTSRNSPQQA